MKARSPLVSLTASLAAYLTLSWSAFSGTYKHIRVDGSFDDWIGVPLAYEDAADSATSADYRRVWLANDEEYLYVRFTTERAVNPFTSHENIFVDADADSTTGFGMIVGSEMLIQGGAGYQEKNGGFNEGGINGLDWQAAPAGAGTQFEVRISRRAVYASDGEPVFVGGAVALVLEAEDANFARQETAPDGEGLYYEFAEPPPPFTGNSVLLAFGAQWSYWTTSTSPGSGWAAGDYDDTVGGWSRGAGLLGYTGNAAVYPAPIATALGATPKTHYLRAKFPWNADPSGVLFVATNYLSDGAVFYLNGAEVKRVRMPEGEIGAETPATGGPVVAGEAGLWALPTGPLVEGENVLAVEVHQDSGTPSELVFGLSLTATTSYPVKLTDATQPADRAVVGGQPVSMAVEVLGTGPVSYVWMKDGQPIPGATNAVLAWEAALPTDAGSYSVRVSNPANAAGVTSRAAVLTVLSTPVTITQNPVALAVTEGDPARFSVTATGSAPIEYQWYRGEEAISGATQALLEIPSVSQADAGDYWVEVRNPATALVRSATARLSVARDVSAPFLVSVVGSPNRVVLRFSEPVDRASAETLANYGSATGLAVLSATWDEAAPEAVVLRTGPQEIGQRYEMLIGAVKDRFGNAHASTGRAFVATIQVDGDFEDWGGMEPAIDDPEDAENATDYAKVWITSDADYVYLRVQLHRPSDLGIFYNNIFVNADGDSTTGFGFRAVGSEMLIQGGTGYQQKGGAFNEGAVSGLNWQMVPEGVAGEYEIRFSRHATFVNDGLPVFSAGTVSLFLESENTSFQTVDVAPDVEPLVHELRNPVPAELGALSMVRSGNGFRVTWSGEGRLQETARLGPAVWQDVPGAASPFEFAPSAATRFFRLIR